MSPLAPAPSSDADRASLADAPQVAYTRHGNWAEIQLTRPPANALDLATMDALHAALDEAESSVDGVLLTGSPGMFSAGLDVVALQPCDRDAMATFWERFGTFFVRLYRTPLATVAALEGHAPAGGCVLAIACDYRVMARGRYKIGLNEVAVGLAVPGWLADVYAGLVGPRLAERNLQLGRMVGPEEAGRCGLVDAVVPQDEVRAAALAELELRLAMPQQARRKTKLALRGAAAASMEADRVSHLPALLDTWFSDECRSVMGALVERLRAKS